MDAIGANNISGVKQAFLDWLSKENVNIISPTKVVYYLEKISEYSRNKKFCETDFWFITEADDFEQVFVRFLDARLVNSLDRRSYKTLASIGQLYLKFLKLNLLPHLSSRDIAKDPLKSIRPSTNLFDVQDDKMVETEHICHTSHDINPEDLIAWLVTQPNANGTLYLESVVRQYIWALRFAPHKLFLADGSNRNVFSCSTVDELNSLWDLYRSAPNYKDVNTRTSAQFSAGLNCLSRYIKYLSLRKGNLTTTSNDFDPVSDFLQANNVTPLPFSQSSTLVDFSRSQSLAQTQPISCVINGQTIRLKNLNWSQLLIAITEWFITEANSCLASLDKVPVYGSRPFFLLNKPTIGTSALLTNGKWISTNYNPQTIVIIIRNLCQFCDVGLESVSISYKAKNSSSLESGNKPTRSGVDSKDPDESISVFDPNVVNSVIEILSAHFQNGFRVNSPIELIRFRRFSADDSIDGLPDNDENLTRIISNSGTLFEGKVYVVKSETEKKLVEEIRKELDYGAEIIYYTPFFTLHEDWLYAGKIISAGMLKEVLGRLLPEYTYKQSYFSTKGRNFSELTIIKNEIFRIWNGDVLLNYEQISSRLRYIPIDKIRYVLTINNEFIWNTTEEYTHIGMVDISDEERINIEDFVNKACRADGYTSMSDVPLSEIENHNNELSLTAIHNAVYYIVLSDQYEKQGKILTVKGNSMNAVTLIKNYCHTIDKCTMHELVQYEKDLTGNGYPWIALEAGYEVLVRISDDAFVAEKYIHFDVEKIDAAIDLFVTGPYLTLKCVTTFAAFPHCGQPWNLFLLESFCRRFSSRYRFESLSMNSRNVGAIIRKNCEFTYYEIMADAVAASDVDFKKTTVIEFLYSNGYIGKRHYASTEKLIEYARTLRGRRN